MKNFLNRTRRLRLLSWLFTVLSVVLVALSFPADGLYGVGLALAGITAAIVSIRLGKRAGGTR